MSFDYSKLKGRIIEKFGSQIDFAKAMNWSGRTLTLKMNNKVPWKQTDIYRAIKILELDETDIPVYFFKVKVKLFNF